MTWEPVDPARQRARIAEIGAIVGEQVKEISEILHVELSEQIPELQGDTLLLDLLFTSVESNIETIGHVARYDVAVDDVITPFGAREYARRVAQHGISPTALIRAYRLGQQYFLEWALAQLAEMEDDPAVAYAAAQEFMSMIFRYIDSISEQVVLEYEMEREKWLAHRSTLRTEVLDHLIAGERVDVAAAESALGHRLHQHHLGAVVWSPERDTAEDTLGEMQRFTALAGRALGLSATPLFQPLDRTSGWVWFPLGHAGAEIRPRVWSEALKGVGVDARVALGTSHPGVDGFRITHEEALRAQQVALTAGESGRRVVSYADAGVRTAAMLAADLAGTRQLVASSLGGLAENSDAAARLRETLGVFLAEKSSYVATAERMLLHKNTVKYRVDKAMARRGRPLDENRLELELGLLACDWLGPTVLPGQ